MSFSGTTTNIPDREPSQFGLESSETNTNQAARPVPYIAGTVRVGLTWLDEPWDVKVDPVQQDIKKQDPITIGYKYYASLAGLIGHGPADMLTEVWFDNKQVWSGVVLRDGNDFEDITIEDKGNMRLYWGTETQTQDPTLGSSPNDHPAYRGQVYVVFDQLYFGYQRTNAPNVELIITRWPKPSWMTKDGNSQGDANPVAIASDWLQNSRYGLGLPDSRLDTSTLDGIASTLHDECLGLAPVVTTQRSIRQLLISLNEYIDGYVRRKEDGTITLGILRELAADSSLTNLDETHLMDEPEFEPSSWETTSSSAQISFTNRENHHKEDSITWVDLANVQITGELTTQSVERPWVTRRPYAAALAGAIAKQAALPATTGKIRVRQSAVTSLKAGDGFRLSYGHYGLCYLVCRCRSKKIPRPDEGVVDIEFRVDTGSLTKLHSTPPSYTPPAKEDLDPEAIQYQRLIELPYTHRLGHETGVMFLAARPNDHTNSLNIHRKKPSGSYEQVLRSTSPYAMRGHLLEAYPETTLIDDQQGMLIEFDGTDTTLTGPIAPLSDSLNNEWVLFIGDEILALFDAELVAASQYRVYTIRARFDTERAAHSNGAEVFVINPSHIPVWLGQNRALPQTFKLQPVALGEGLALSEIDEEEITLDDRALRPYGALNCRKVAQTKLSSAVGAADTTIDINDETGFPIIETVPFRIEINDEIMRVVGGHGTTTWTVERGQSGTTATTHDPEDEVFHEGKRGETLHDQYDSQKIQNLGRDLFRKFKLAWDITTEERQNFWGAHNENLPVTSIQFLTTSDTEIGSVEVPPGFSSVTVDDQEILETIVGFTDFHVRAYHKRNGLRSATYSELRLYQA